MRLPKASERLDPPLVDVLVEDGFRKGNLNLPEARFIVDEIKKICADETRRDIHSEPDWLLIYRLDNDVVRFERTGTHSDLFGK